MGRLAKLLQNYYKIKGNKILFKNDLNLNALSLLIWDRLGYREMDSSVLSRVIHGERLFTLKQLEVFCDVLLLEENEKRQLRRALNHDILLRNNVDISEEENLLNMTRQKYDQVLNILRVLRRDGHPQETVSLSELFENTINSSSNLENRDKRTLGMIYNERSRAFGEVSSPQKVLSLMSKLNEKAIELGKEVKDHEILDMAYMNVGGAYYVAKRWKDSSAFLENKFSKVSSKTKIEFARTLLLDYAYLGDYSKFKGTLGKSIKIIDKYSSNQAILASIYEAISRSLAIFGFAKEARRILEEVQKLRLDPFYESQILRGYIYTFYSEKRKNKRIDYDKLTSIIKVSRQEKFIPYKRHKNQINKIIKEIGIIA